MKKFDYSDPGHLFPYFGGKSRVADEVWRRFGQVRGYCEPFAGSLAVMLRNPRWQNLTSEQVNDLDGFICNFWRSVAQYPDEVAAAADWPVNHIDLFARHTWLRQHRDDLTQNLRADIDWCEPNVAGVWVWGISQWIGGNWCHESSDKRPHLANAGRGVHSIGQRPHLADAGRGGFYDYMKALSVRLRRTRITCCDWSSFRSTLRDANPWGLFLDPPYTDRKRDSSLYGETEDYSIADEVREWAIEASDAGNKVAFCGQYEEHDFPDDWQVYDWSTGGYGYGGRDRREVIWFSPGCLGEPQRSLL